MKAPCAAAVLLLLAGSCTTQSDSPPAPSTSTTAKSRGAEKITVQGGLSTPESAIHDTVADVYLVSNINGDPFGADGKGFISRMNPDGSDLKLRWIDGAKDGFTLNAPKGMAIARNILYVADVTAVRKFDRKTGAPMGQIRVIGATFLNDLCSNDQGEVFVSDTGMKAGFEKSGTDAIYRIGADDSVTLVCGGVELGQPNGLTHVGGTLYAVTWDSGKLLKIGADNKPTEWIALPKNQLDGIERMKDGNFVVSSWADQCLYAITPEGEVSKIVENVEAPADQGYDAQRDRVLLPFFNGAKLEIYP